MSKKTGTIHCYMKKGWTGYVTGYKKYTANWDETFGKKEIGCKKCDKITCICGKK
jgi:hypothetical protein